MSDKNPGKPDSHLKKQSIAGKKPAFQNQYNGSFPLNVPNPFQAQPPAGFDGNAAPNENPVIQQIIDDAGHQHGDFNKIADKKLAPKDAPENAPENAPEMAPPTAPVSVPPPELDES